MKFLPKEEQPGTTLVAESPMLEKTDGGNTALREKMELKRASAIESNEKVIFQTQADAPPCHECGSIMIRSGSCYKCLQCGSTSGCS
jgi:ribonucleoside-diphosphate reductase alpha chain